MSDVFHVYCSFHHCDLVENEHYDRWFQEMDMSGFYCPKWNPDDPTTDDCSDHWKISPIGHDEINIMDLV